VNEPTNKDGYNADIDPKTVPGSHAAYYVAPDSCDPLPAEYWSSVTTESLAAAVKLIENSVPRSEAEERYDKAKHLAPRIFRLAAPERELLQRFGGEALIDALDYHDRLSGP
jgi:hypothetical protein